MFANSANGLSATITNRKISVRPASRMLSAISFGVLRRSAPSTSAIMRSRNDLPGSCVISTTIRSREHARAAGDRAAVAAGLADDRRRLAGDRRLVDGGDALDHGAVAGDHLAGLDDHDVAALQLRTRRPRAPSASRAVGLGAHRPQRRGLRAAAALGQRLGEVGEHDGQPQPDRDREREPARARRRRQRWPPKSWISQAIVVISAPTSTTNMTGLRTCTRGSSFLNEAPIAGHRISGVNRDFDARAASGRRGRGRSLGGGHRSECLVELGGVDARLAEQAEEAAVGVVVDELLDAGEREAAHRGDAARLDARRWPREMCGSTPEPDVVTASAGTFAFVRPGLYGPLSLR